MAKRKTKRYPGSIYVPKGRKQLRVKVKNPDYQPGNPSSQRYKVIASGLPDTPQGWKYAEEILEQFWLQRKGLLAPTEEKKAKYTFQQVWEEYETIRGQKLLPDTVKVYHFGFNNVVTDGTIPCTKANLFRFIKVYVTTRKEKYEPITFNNNLRFTKTVIKWAARHGYMQEKVTDEEVNEFYLPVPEKENKYFTLEESNNICDYFEKKAVRGYKEFGLLLKVMWMTGARISDVLTLTWKQVNTQDKEIIWKNKISKKPEPVPVSNAVLAVLAQVKEITPEREKVFIWESYKHKMLRARLNRALHVLEIKRNGRSFHSFRKAFCNNVFDLNYPLPTSLALVRHKTVDVTIKHYLRRNTDQMHEAVNRLPQ